MTMFKAIECQVVMSLFELQPQNIAIITVIYPYVCMANMNHFTPTFFLEVYSKSSQLMQASIIM